MRNSYLLRRVASVVTASVILLGVPLVGGAWLSSEPVVEVVPDASADVAASSAATTETSEATAAPQASSSTVVTSAGMRSVLEPVLPVAEPSADEVETLTCIDCDADASDVAVEVSAPVAGVETAGPSIRDTSKGLPGAPEFSRLVPLDPTSAEDWRPLISEFFDPGDVDRAVRVVRCESHGDPDAKNPRSTASGLFQHLASLWPERSVKAGYGEYDVFDPVANVAVAAWLVYEGGGWSHWNPSRGCWG